MLKAGLQVPTELLVLSTLDHIWSYVEACTDFFSHAKQTIIGRVADPVTGNDVNDLKPLYKILLSNRFSENAVTVQKAISLESEGKVFIAALFWKKVFGNEFPR